MNYAEQRAIKTAQKKFKGLNQSEKLKLANDFIKHATSKGATIQQALSFLTKAEVMTDTELMHATTF